MKKNFKILFPLILLLSSCSHIQYTTRQKLPVHFTQKKEHGDFLEVEEKVPFFFYGLFPKIQKVHLDEIALEKEFSEVSRITIYERPDFSDILFSVLTLGFYTPRTITISALGIKH